MVSLLTLPFGDEDTRIRPRALRLAHPFATLSLCPGALTSRWSSTSRFRAARVLTDTGGSLRRGRAVRSPSLESLRH
jgi:hypothetical protein